MPYGAGDPWRSVTFGGRMKDHQNNFDLLRLLAALQVVYMHAAEWLKLPVIQPPLSWAPNLFPGVAVFFVISGFLVTRSFLASKSGTAGYLVRRGLRIYPGLWVHFGVIFIMLAVAGALPLSRLASAAFWRWIAGAFVMGSDPWGNLFGGIIFDYSGFYRDFPSGVLWTITVELIFYLLVPIAFAGVIRKRNLVWLSIATLATVSLTLALLANRWAIESPNGIGGKLRSSPAALFWVFLVGATMSFYWKGIRKYVEGQAWKWLLAYVALSQLDYYLFHQQVLDFIKPTLLTAPRVVLLGIAVISFAYSWRRLASVLRGVDLSYGIYLYHMPFIATLYYANVSSHWWLWLLAYAVPTFVAAMSWHFVEKPCLSLKGKADELVVGLRQWNFGLPSKPAASSVNLDAPKQAEID